MERDDRGPRRPVAVAAVFVVDVVVVRPPVAVDEDLRITMLMVLLLRRRDLTR